MPKSKRAKLVSLTKTKTDRATLKRGLVESVRESVDRYRYVYVVAYENMRTSFFKDLRREWSDSRFILGKNKVVQIALSADAGEGEGAGEGGDGGYRPGLAQLADDVSGNVGLLFTDKDPKEVKSFFEGFGEPDYARAGFVPAETITVPAGKLPTETFPHTQADALRKLGVPVRLDKAVVVVTQETVLCTEGVPITPEQGRLLKLFGHRLAVFSVSLVSVWKKKVSGGAGKKKGGAGAGAAAAEEDGAAAGGVYERLGDEEDPEAASAKAAKARKRKAAMKKNKGSFGRRGAGGEEEEEDEDEDDEEDGEEGEGMDEEDEEDDDE